jgi:hypothetical protein
MTFVHPQNFAYFELIKLVFSNKTPELHRAHDIHVQKILNLPLYRRIRRIHFKCEKIEKNKN